LLLDFAYFRRSRVERKADALALMLSPNLARAPVSFEAELAKPLRFREAVSALHEIVVSDLRFKPKDRAAYRAWLKEQGEDDRRLREAAVAHAKEELEARRAAMDLPPDLGRQYGRWHKVYWKARRSYAEHLYRNDPALWRNLMPCDPVITVAPDVVFFECFSADESSYGCLSVERDAMFKGASAVQTGTTNVDYSWALYDHFQQLRTYRATRFHVDPSGFEVKVKGDDCREEKIDLPDSWLRGFLQLQAAMTLPSKRVALDRECVYSILVHLRRHKARRSPRALRFELAPGRPPEVVLEPWDLRAVSKRTRWEGNPQAIRIWGRQRLLVLNRVLPLADGIDVHLLGDGLPSFWVVRMGEMRLTLGLSGWTVNDWTRSSALDLLAPQAELRPETVKTMAEALLARQKMKEAEFGARPDVARAGLYRLARLGQSIHDLHEDVVRWRRVMPPEVAVEKLVAENEEAVASRLLRVKVERDETTPSGLRVLVGNAGGPSFEGLLDKDGIFKRAKCACSWFHKGGLKKGPCRHLLALRTAVWKP
jgi:hypothetical protein